MSTWLITMYRTVKCMCAGNVDDINTHTLFQAEQYGV